MKYQILFSGRNMKNINLLSAEFAHSVLSVNYWLMCLKAT